MHTAFRPRHIAASTRATILTMALSLGATCLLAPADTPPREPAHVKAAAEARAAMRAGNYATAVDHFDALLTDTPANPHELHYLKARARYLDGEPAACLEALVPFGAESQPSPWHAKARFLRARVLADQKRFEEAEAIYEAEAHRLLSAARKTEVTRVIIDFADRLATRPPEGALDASPPNFNKAYKLYQRALKMEIDRDLKDELMFKKARAIQEAGNASAAIRDLQQYLDAFDPTWRGPTGTAELQVVNPPPPGTHIVQARYRLARARVDSGQHDRGRWQAEDLVRMLSAADASEHAASRLADTRWLIVRSYRLGQAHDAQLDMAVTAAREFLEYHPDDPRAVKAAFDIARAYERHGRTDDAIAAYRAFIDGKDFRLPDGDAATAPHDDLAESPAELKSKWTPLALYRIGAIQAQQRRYDDAIATWQQYVNRYPNGANWSASQNGIVNARFQQGVQALAARDYREARATFEAFLREHPLDARAPRILFAYGQMAAVRADDAYAADPDGADTRARYREAIAEWRKLIAKYPKSQEASLAQYRTGRIYEEKLRDFDAALDAYRRLNWGSYASRARQRVQVMTDKQLDIDTERVFRTDETARVDVRTRNIETLTVRLYRIDLEAYFRKTHAVGAVNELDVSLIEPDETWGKAIEEYQPYVPYRQTIDIPFEDDQPGACVVSVTDGETWRATTLVLRSDLEIIFKSSRRQVLVFAQDRRRNKPADDVRVLLSNGESVFHTGTTGRDGIHLDTVDTLEDLDGVRLLAIRDGHVAAHNLNLKGLALSSGLTPKGYIYTHRHVYRPGERVACRGILRDVVDDRYVVPDTPGVSVRVLDAQGRMLREDPLTLSRFGSFDLTFPLAEDAPLGTYTIQAEGTNTLGKTLVFSGTFEVQAFKLEKIRLTLDFPETVYFRGETIEGRARAAYYWGQPVADTPLRLTLPDGRVLNQRTDEDGRVDITFDTTPMTPGQALSFEARLERANLTTRTTLSLARLGFTAAVEPSETLVLSGAPFDVSVRTRAANGDPVGETLTLFVLRRETQQSDAVLDGIPWLSPPTQSAAEVTVAEHIITTDPETGNATQTLALEKGGDYVLRVAGEDRFEQTVTAQGTLEVSDEDDATRLRLFADAATLQVGEDARVRLHSRMEPALALVTYEGETVLRHDVVPVQKGFNDIRFDVGHDLFPNLRIAAATIDDRTLRTAAKSFTVERELRIAVRPQAVYSPGATGAVDLVVTDQLGHPVEAELSLALADQALFDSFRDTRPEILDFFQAAARRHAEFRTGSSCGFAYAGHTEAVAKAVVAEGERLTRLAEEAKRQQLRKEKSRKGVYLARSESGVLRPGAAVNGPAPSAAPEPLVAGEVATAAAAMPADTEFGEVSDLRHGLGFAQAKEPPAPKPRHEAPDAGYWLPAVVTDADGKATVSIPMPEKTTAWRLTSRGCTPETLVGQATADTITRKDFFVSLKTPSFVRDGDAVRVMARVHSLQADNVGPVTATLQVTGGIGGRTPIATREQTVELDNAGLADVIFRAVDVPETLSLTLQVTARAGDTGDSLVSTLPVIPWGLEYADHDGGVSDDSVTALLQLPAQPACERRWLTVSVGADMRRSLVDMALADTPRILPTRAGSAALASSVLVPGCVVYGGTPGSDLLATVSVLACARRSHLPPEDVATLKRRARALVAALVATQGKDGAWISHAGQRDYADWQVTALAYWALAAAREAGVAVHGPTLDKTRQYLIGRLSSFSAQSYEAKAVVLHALSVSGDAEYAKINRIYRERNALGATALAYTALTFANLGREPVARELSELLLAKATTMNPDGVGTPRIHWTHGASQRRQQSDIQATALALLLLARTRPDAEQGHAAAHWLIQQRGTYPFRAGNARGPVLAGLAAWFGAGEQARADFEVTVQVNGTDLGTFTSDDLARLAMLAVPTNLVTDGENRVEFRKRGRGTFLYAASLRGFSRSIHNPASFAYPHLDHKRYYHDQLRYRGNPIGASSTTQITQLEPEQRTRVNLEFHSHRYKGYLIVESPLPAGAMLVKGSVKGNYEHYENRGDRLVFFYRPNGYAGDIHYDLVGYAPGTYRAMPVVMRDAMQPGRMQVHGAGTLTVLAPGETSDDPYKRNRSELYALGTLYFKDGLYADALEYLTTLYKRDHDYNEKHLARMLLWILTDKRFYEAPRVVEMFEVLRERYPDLEIPFDKILVVGRAYRDIGEFERAWLIFRATINGSFVSDSNVSAILEDEGRFLHSIDYQYALWRTYPDTPRVVSAYFALTQALYRKAPDAHALPEEDGVQPERLDMLERSADMLVDFLTLYPGEPLADDAAFSLANAALDMAEYEGVVRLSARFAARYPDSKLASSFRYMQALGHFWQNAYDDALEAAVSVAEGDSRDKTFAQYIVGQIHHAQGNPGEAIAWYRTVARDYPDAAQSIDYFEDTDVSMDEVTIVRPGDEVVLPLSYRNIKEAFLQVYRVDLMKLYLREKNLSRIAGIHLAGIAPELEKAIPLGDGHDYLDKTRDIALDLTEEGAYLVICRGDDLFTSGLVLITPLKIEVQLYADSGRVRANVLDAVAGGYRPNVHVKAVGSADDDFRGGETDLRGIFVADNLRGKPTVIAREGESRYAFYRGDTWVGPPQSQQGGRTPEKQKAQPADYQMNLRTFNEAIQRENIQEFDQMRRVQQQGIQVKAAF